MDMTSYDNDDTNYELNASIHHMMGQWAPYVEFGDVSTSSTKSDSRTT